MLLTRGTRRVPGGKLIYNSPFYNPSDLSVRPYPFYNFINAL